MRRATAVRMAAQDRTAIARGDVQPIIQSARAHLRGTVRAALEGAEDLGTAWARALLMALESSFEEYVRTVLIGTARTAMSGYAAGSLRALIPSLVDNIVPNNGLTAEARIGSLEPDGLWEELLNRTYSDYAAGPHNGFLAADAFRAQYVFRFRKRQLRNAFIQKLQAAAIGALRDIEASANGRSGDRRLQRVSQ